MLHSTGRLVGAIALASLAPSLGLTHVVTGEVTGSAGRCTVTYRLQAVPALAAVGAPLILSGSPADLVRALPGAARDLAARLGVRDPALPSLQEGESAML